MSSPPESDRISFLRTDPPEAWRPLRRLAQKARRPVERFLAIEASSGILLLLAAAAALLWANSDHAESYHALWHTPLGVRAGSLAFERPLEWWVNDGLMVIFFFVVGMEIRREIHSGALADLRSAALPAVAALGGMLAPAALYLSFAHAEERHGWGVPMATDIAFAVGILTMLGKRVPPSLRVLLLALAVIDDLGAIIVIALFYSEGVWLPGLAIGATGLVGIVVMQRVGVRSKPAYILPALVCWAGVYASGVHPTIAGVLIGLLTPVRAWLGASGFQSEIRHQLDVLEDDAVPSRLEASVHRVDVARREALSPAESLIHGLHPWVAFGIMPVFALANAGVSISGSGVDVTSSPAFWGAAVGLVVGKPIGVLLACWLAQASGIAAMPRELARRHLVLLGLVAGIGFTMALFIAALAFEDAEHLAAAKLGVLVASACAALLALSYGRATLRAGAAPAPLASDEAESSAA